MDKTVDRKMPYEYCDQADAKRGVKMAEEVIGLVNIEIREK